MYAGLRRPGRDVDAAKRERESLLSGLREGRIAAKDGATFADVFAEWQDARNLSDRTREYEQYVLDHHLATMKDRKVQDIAASDVARVLRSMRNTYSGWTCSAVYKVMKGTFSLALRRRIITRNPVDGLAPSERPKQRNARKIAVLMRRPWRSWSMLPPQSGGRPHSGSRHSRGSASVRFEVFAGATST